MCVDLFRSTKSLDKNGSQVVPVSAATTTTSCDNQPSLTAVSKPASSITTTVSVGAMASKEKESLSKEQMAEWSKVMFKCIHPIGSPEFRVVGNIATHTITLKIDMTAVDLRHAEAICTREQVMKYEQLGMRREEIAEVALKLNAIKHLGINLRIDDLFNEHGFMVVDSSDMHDEKEDAVYFVEDGKHNSIKGKEKLIKEELLRSEVVNMDPEKEKVIQREMSDTGEGRETDLLQSMTMKIRFMKRVSGDGTYDRPPAENEQMMFESCDQVQMKLTQLELNTMRLMCTNTCLAANLGMLARAKESVSTPAKVSNDHAGYVNTNTHQPFVDLLLEQGKQSQAANNKKKAKHKPDSKEGSEEAVSTSVTRLPEQATDQVPSILPKSSVCIPSQSQSCQCFACIGAVAAQQTAVSASTVFLPMSLKTAACSRITFIFYGFNNLT